LRHTYRFVILAIDRRDGRIVWEKVAHEDRPHESTHPLNGTWASSSAVTDGERVIAYFESNGLYAYDLNGTLLWQKSFGHKNVLSETGEGTTPALYGDYVVVVWDHQGGSGSFIVALDKRTGREIWKADREELDTWSTPLIVDYEGRRQVITSGWASVSSYDLETGKILWHTGGLTPLTIPSPVMEDGLVIATSGFNGSSLKAIRLTNPGGDLTGTGAIAWSLDRDTPYVPSPLLYGGVLYLLKSNSGILSVFDAKTGTPHYRLQRLQALPNVYASPVGADGRVYITGREGTTLVIRHGTKFEVLATNHLEDEFEASPALVGNEIYLRGNSYLYCIAETAPTSPAH
jgi:outer membrane protein assembly factor BamB